MQIIASGKTERCERSQILQNIENSNNIWTTHSQNGWSTIETFKEFLQNLRAYCGNNPIYLILDCYSVHRADAIKEKAKELNIELIFIPPGMTDRIQPLDLRIFGPLKSISKRLFRNSQNQGQRKKPDAVSDLVTAWGLIKEDLIIQAWFEIIQ